MRFILTLALAAALVVLLGAAGNSGGAAGSGQFVKVFRVQVPPEPAPPPPPPPPPPFVPIVDNELLIWPWHPLYRGQFFRDRYGIELPLGGYANARDLATADPLYPYRQLPEASGSRRVLVVVDPRDAPGAVYYYVDSFPPYYALPGYFPANRNQAGYGAATAKPSGQEGSEEAQREKGVGQPEPPGPSVPAFSSTLAPMLGGPERVTVHYAVGDLKLRTGDYANAAAAFKRAVAAAPEDPAAKIALSLALTATGDYRAAAHILRRGLRGLPDWGALQLRSERAFGTEEAYGKVLDGLQEAGRRDESDPDVQLLLGFLGYSRGQFQEASDHLSRAGLDDPLVMDLLQEAKRRAAPAAAAPGNNPE